LIKGYINKITQFFNIKQIYFNSEKHIILKYKFIKINFKLAIPHALQVIKVNEEKKA